MRTISVCSESDGTFIGVAEYPESTTNALNLINLAEIVMLKAKRKGKNNVQYYDKPIIDEYLRNSTMSHIKIDIDPLYLE